MDCFSSASSLARIFVSTVAVRVAGSGCVTVAEGEAGNGTCTGLLTSVPVFSMVGSAGVLFLRRGVGGSSLTTIGWEFGVAARPCGAGKVDTVHFASCGGLTLVGLGVSGSDGTGGMDFSVDPNAVRFRPVIGVELVSVGIPSHVTCSPSH